MKLNAEKLRVLMAQNKLTLSAMVNKAKVSRSTMWQILNRKESPIRKPLARLPRPWTYPRPTLSKNNKYPVSAY